MVDTPPPADVRVTRRFTDRPERVFDAWLDPDTIERWMTGPSPSNDVVHIQTDPRVGGAFSFLLSRDGQEVDHVGVYLEIVRPRRLVFTFDAVAGRAPTPTPDKPSPHPTTVSLDLAAFGDDETELVLSHEGVPPEYRANTEAGWSAILDAVASTLGEPERPAPPSPYPSHAEDAPGH